MSQINLSFNIDSILHNTIFRFVVAYIFILEIVASQQSDHSIFKNIFVRLFTIFLVFTILGFNIIESSAAALGFTTVFFVVAEK